MLLVRAREDPRCARPKNRDGGCASARGAPAPGGRCTGVGTMELESPNLPVLQVFLEGTMAFSCYKGGPTSVKHEVDRSIEVDIC